MVFVWKDNFNYNTVITRGIMGNDRWCTNFKEQQEQYQNKPKREQKASTFMADYTVKSKCVLSAGKNISSVCLCIRLTENGVQGEQLARDLLSVSALPAADRNQVLHPQR